MPDDTLLQLIHSDLQELRADVRNSNAQTSDTNERVARIESSIQALTGPDGTIPILQAQVARNTTFVNKVAGVFAFITFITGAGILSLMHYAHTLYLSVKK